MTTTLTEFIDNEIHIVQGIRERRMEVLAYQLNLPEDQRRKNLNELLEEIRWAQGYIDACKYFKKEVAKRSDHLRAFE